jgi:hypothetical protein
VLPLQTRVRTDVPGSVHQVLCAQKLPLGQPSCCGLSAHKLWCNRLPSDLPPEHACYSQFETEPVTCGAAALPSNLSPGGPPNMSSPKSDDWTVRAGRFGPGLLGRQSSPTKQLPVLMGQSCGRSMLLEVGHPTGLAWPLFVVHHVHA